MKKMSNLKIAVLQKRAGQNCEQNTKDGLAYLKQAKQMGADLLLFPECFITGYALPITNDEALGGDSPYIKQFCQACSELSIGAVVTAFTKGNARPQNSAFVIGRDGQILMKYSKVHTCAFSDEACLERGTAFSVCEFDGVTLGVMICYDREYPESARELMLMGAELILVPNDCGSMEPRLCALKTRAYENMCGVVMANPPGKGAGRSCAFSPIAWNEDGECLNMEIFVAGEQEKGLFLADYDLNKLRDYRSSEMMGNTFRNVPAYRHLMNGTVTEPFIR